MLKTKTWADQRKDQLQRVKNRVLELTGITEDQLSEMIFKHGIKWVSSRVDGDDMGVSVLSSSPQFWDWYTNQWNLTDEVWVASHTQGDITDYLVLNGLEGVCNIRTADKRILRAEYAQLHSGEMIARPGAEVWEDVHERIISSVLQAKDDELAKEVKHV